MKKLLKLTGIAFAISIFFVLVVSATAFADDEIYRIDSAGSSDWGTVTKWSLTSGGASAGIAPNMTSQVIFDDNSGFTSATVISLTGDITVANFTANHSPERILIQSNALGTTRTFTSGNATIQNIDFMDITGAGAASWDFSAQDNIGDCGGNTNITFPASTTQTWDGTTGSWSNAAKWTSRVPLPQDDVSAGGTGNTITIDIPRIGGNVTLTGDATINSAAVLRAVFGSFIIGDNINLSTNWYIDLRGRGTYTFNNGGKTLYNFNLKAPSGNYTCVLSGLPSVASGSVVEQGTINFGNSIISIANYSITGTGTRSVNLDNSEITLSRTAVGTNWNATTITNLSFDAGTSTIIYSNSSTNAQTFAGGGLDYYNVQVAGAGNYALTVTGSNTFKSFKVDASEADKTVNMASGTVQHITDLTRDYGTNIITLTGSGNWTANTTAGTPISLDYFNVSRMQTNIPDTWYFGTNSVDSGNNDAGVIFDEPDLTAYFVTGEATDIAMNPGGITTGNFNGTLTPVRGTTPLAVSFTGYGGTEVYSALMEAGGVITYPFSLSLETDKTYNYNLSVENINSGTVYSGGSKSFYVPLRVSIYSGVDPITAVVPILLLIAFLSGGGILVFSGVRDIKYDAQSAAMKWAIGLVIIGMGFFLYTLVLDVLTVLRGGLY